MPFGIWQPMACEWFPIDPDENLNFKFISKFALINVILFFFYKFKFCCVNQTKNMKY
jgi:hypothetical protein